jgi:DNA-binding helix-hairpin-helix protein with protein kinase domain
MSATATTPDLQPGDRVIDRQSHAAWTIERVLGAGAQGTVYAATGPTGPVAVKWSSGDQATPERRAAIATLTAAAHAPSDRLVWPIALVDADTRDGFGYFMPLVPTPPFVEMAEVMSRRVWPTHTALVSAALALTVTVGRLHDHRFVYRDLSHSNLMLDPRTGDIRVFDVDNVVRDAPDLPHTIGGTRGYMPPEALTAGIRPGKGADLHALAVLIFVLLANHHPLRGRLEFAYPVLDDAAWHDLFGKKARFIFSPYHDDNRPDPEAHANAIAFWAIFPEHLRHQFHRAFVTYLGAARGRVSAREWRQTLEALLDGISPCPQCGAELYDEPTATTAPICWGCARSRPERLLLQSPHARVALHAGIDGRIPATRLRLRHFGPGDGVGATVIGEVESVVDGSFVRLRNLSATPWQIGPSASSLTTTIAPGDIAALARGDWLHPGRGSPGQVV